MYLVYFSVILSFLFVCCPWSNARSVDGGKNHSTSAASNLSSITLRESDSGDRRFVDKYGRERYFHGVNAVTKGPPWVPSTDEFSTDISMVDHDFMLMKKLGLNVMRLGTMWPG